jgi:hypothetical protein
MAKKVNIKYMKITPKKAEEWLENSDLINRPVNDNWVKDLTSEIKKGNWRGDNAETIKLTKNESVIDGQHRLWAIVFAKQSVYAHVAIGVSSDVFPTIDVGIRRTGGHTLAVASYKNANNLASAARLYYRFKDVGLKKMLSRTGTIKATNKNILDTVDESPELVESVTFVSSFKSVRGLHTGKTSFLHCLFAQKHSEEANTFIEKLYTGEDLGKGSPILALRAKLFAINELKGYINGHSKEFFFIVIAIKAWNAYREDKTKKVLGWGTTEEAPKIK